jgi:CBS domain containing-hemolysin-like protein
LSLLYFPSIITLEDVLEAVLQEQIYDETDVSGKNKRRDTLEMVSQGEDDYHLMPIT